MSFSEQKERAGREERASTLRRKRKHRRSEDWDWQQRKRQRVDITRLPNVQHSNVLHGRRRHALARSTEEKSSSRVCLSRRGSRRHNNSNRNRYLRQGASSPERSLGLTQNPGRSIPRSRPELSRFYRRRHQGSTLRRLKISTYDAARYSLRAPRHRAGRRRRLLRLLMDSDAEEEGISEFSSQTSNSFDRPSRRYNATRRSSVLEASSGGGRRNDSMVTPRSDHSHYTFQERSNRLYNRIGQSPTNRNSISNRGIRDRERGTLSGLSSSRRNYFRPRMLDNFEHKDCSSISDESSDDYSMDACSILFDNFTTPRTESIRRHMGRYESLNDPFEDILRYDAQTQADVLSLIYSGYVSSGDSLPEFFNSQETNGARFDQIDKLPTWKFKLKPKHSQEVEMSNNRKSCCICLDDFKHNDSLRTLQCLHFFHRKCIDKWLLKNRTCPICKFDITNSDSSL